MKAYSEAETRHAPQHVLVLYCDGREMTAEVKRHWFATALPHVPFEPNTFSYLKPRTFASVNRRPKGVAAVLAALESKTEEMDKIISEVIHGKDFQTTYGALAIGSASECASLNYLAREFTVEDAISFLHHLPARPKPQAGMLLTASSGIDAMFKPIGGVTQGRATPIDIERAQALEEDFLWKKAYLQGRLHDIYPLVILSARQAAFDLGGLSLRAWIEQGKRGRLEPWLDDLLIWRVPEGEIEGLRQALLPTGVLCIAR